MNNEWLSRRNFDCSLKSGVLVTKLDCEKDEEMLEELYARQEQEMLEILEGEFKFCEELRD